MIISILTSMLMFALDTLAMTDATTDSTTDAVLILAVSTIWGQENSTPTGSVMGGTTLYLKVQGLDQTASNNAVYVGKYPCLISDKGVNGLFMNCKTTQPDPNDSNLKNLEIVVKVSGKPDSRCTFSSTYCHFTYSSYYTPKLYYVTPRSNYPRSLSYWRAKWTVTSNLVQYLDGQFMGSNRCDRFSIQDDYPDEISFWDDYVACQVSAEIEADYYDYKIKSRNGYQTNDVSVQQKKVYSDETYESKIVPIIKSINTNLASPEGQIIEISGYGFSSILTKNTVKISGQSETIQVLSSTPNTIQAKIPKLSNLPKSSDIAADSLFIQGSGLFYTRWDTSGLNLNCPTFRTQIINKSSQLDSRIQFNGIYPEPDTQNSFGTSYGQYFRGFLKAPLTGNYKFYIASDDCSLFFINSVNSLKVERAADPIASSNLNPYKNYWYEYFNNPSQSPKSISDAVALNQDEYYFIEVYHMNGAGAGYVTLSMEVESTDRKINSLNTVYSLTTSYTSISEVIEFTLYNSNGNTLLSGKYQLQFTYGTKTIPQVGVYYSYTTASLSASASASTLKTAIQNCGGGYWITVKATKLDNTGEPLDDSAVSFAGYKYTIVFDSHRGSLQYRAMPIIVSSTLTGGTVVSNIERTQEPADPISGTFQLAMTINGQENVFQTSDSKYDLPYDVTPTVIADNIERLTGVRPYVWTYGRSYDGWTWYIILRSYVAGLTEFIPLSSALTSGNGDVTIQLSIALQDSNNLLFEPIPNELLFTYSQYPQVQVTTNGILAGCQDNGSCDFTLGDEKTPTLKSFSVSGTQLTVSLQQGTGLTIKQKDLSIQFKGADCTNIQITNQQSPYTVTCDLEQQDGQTVQEAGDNQVPAVHHSSIGYSKIDGSVTGQNVALSITSLSPNTGTTDGGTKVTVTGTGFPKNIEREFTFQVDGVDVTVQSISNTQLVFITPKKTDSGSGAISLQFNGKSATGSFNYDDTLKIQVSSLEFNTAIPTIKGIFKITGSNFGNEVNDIKVTLVGSAKSYNAKVVTVTNSLIEVYLRGGMPGDYRVVVNRKDFGDSYADSNDNLFQYIIPVTSVTLEDGTSQAKGSEAGGTVIKITGSNFVKDETMVFIGNAVNWICEIDESRFTSEVIYCTVPARNENYNNAVQTVVVTLQITLESTCLDQTNQCTFTYDSTLTPSIENYPSSSTQYPGSRILTEEDHQKEDYHKLVLRKRFLWTDESKKKGINHILNLGKSARRDLLTSADLVLSQQKAYAPGDSETLTGTGLSSTISVVFKGPVTYSVSATVTDNSFTYTIPNLPQGQYTTYIQTQTGYANKIWVSVIGLSIKSIDDAAIGGQILTINGVGFNANQSPSVKVSTTQCTELVVVSSTQIQCRMGRVSGTSQVVTVSQLPSENNSAVLLTAQYTLTITSSSLSPSFTAVTVNGASTYDSTNKYYTATTGNVVLVFTGSKLTGTSISSTLEHMGYKISGTISGQSDTSITATFNNLPAGSYSINLLIDSKYAWNSDTTKQQLVVTASLPTSNNPTISYAGGATLTFTGTGFDTTKQQNSVTLCGFSCPITASSFNSLSCEAPKLLTSSIISQYTALKEPARYILSPEVTLTADGTTSVFNFFDLQQSTYYKSTSASNCFVQVDFGTDRVLLLHQLRYLPRIDVAAIYLKDAVFQYTTDGTNWQTLLTVDQTVHTGWNIYVPQADIPRIRAVRLFDSRGTKGSSCQLAEIELKGWILSSSTNTYGSPISCNAVISVNGQSLGTVTNAASYSASVVPIVNTVSPSSGRFTEEAVITITGTGFVNGQTTVTIDGVVCEIQSVSATQITCKTGVKDLEVTQLDGVFEVRVNGNLAANNQKFIYATKWSDLETWGGYEYPGEGDSVIVNMGQTLIVDVQTPKLMQVLVEGTLTFSDEVDTSLDAHYIVIREGKFNIGTELVPHQHKVQITLYGVEEDIQMPAMGNKVLGCHQCQLIIHGVERTPTWTLLSSTVNAGDTTITVDDAVDWQIGEQIVITSSEVEHTQSEKRYITAVSGDKKTLTLDQPLTYRHYSAIETYTSGSTTEQFPMKVEVGLLTRNIVIQGEQSDLKHGYHLMIHGRAEKGAIGKISYAEFRYGGQPRIIGRYPIHFHLNGEIDESYVVGNAIHDCYARCITIHGVHYLKVQKNVCYNTFGHAIFLEDGIETNNVIEDNLVASTRQSWIMLQTDITVATYWVTNPQNILRRNRSGGSEWYGFWYEIKTNPDGPSATSDICPPGLNVIEFKDNWSHSNGRFGLRIFLLAPRQYPCQTPENWGNDQPYLENPSLQAVFEQFFTWKNNECGILAEELGNVYFKDIMIADSKFAGFQAHKGNFSDEGAVLDNALIIGQSLGNPSASEYYDGSRALVVPRTNGFLAKNIRIHNYGSNSAIIESCSVCWSFKLWVQGGKNTQLSNIQIFNSETANRIYWQLHRREIFWDQDGSFTNTPGGAYIIPYKKHIDGIPGCENHPESFWDDSIICAMNQVTIRDVLLVDPTPQIDFQGVDMKLFRLDSTNIGVKMDRNLDDTKIQKEQMKVIKKSFDVKFSFASVYATGFTYNVHFKLGAQDPLSMGVFASPYFKEEDKAVILRFNYSSNRETFDIFRNIGGNFPLRYTEIQAIPDTNTCHQGDWYNDKTNKLFFICLSGKNKKKYEYVEVRGIICRDTCDSLGDVEQEDGYRYWSDPETWIDNKVPLEGDSPIVQAAYQVILDVDPPKLANLTILGTLIFDERKATTNLQAERIWVRSGKLFAGNSTTPFPGKITITLNGEFGDAPLVIDQNLDVGNKVLAVTKGMELYSKTPGTVWTRLAAFADAGATQVTVIECADWKIGDEIVFGPSGNNPEQREKKRITAVSGCTITLDSALEFNHYGSPDITIDKEGVGQLDMRAVVGHLTRNIKIEGGPSVDGLGCRVLIYQFDEPGSDTGVPRRGYTILHGVEFNNCGQYDTQRSGLDFRSLNSDIVKTPSEVVGCSFHDSTGILMTIQNSQYITIKNNIFFTGIKALVQINNSQYVKFQENALIYVKKRQIDSGMVNWAVLGNFIYMEEEVPSEMIRGVIDVSKNVGQGSQDSGFFVMASKCSDAYQSSFYDNQCSSSILSCFGIRQDYSGGCTYIQGLSAYHSKVGIMFAVNAESLQLERAIAAENEIGIVLRGAPQSVDNNQIKFSNSFVSAFARTNCPKCYLSNLGPQCNSVYGVKMGTLTSSAFPPISQKKTSEQFDSVCTVQRVDLRVYINNVEFSNFKMSYDNAPRCGKNAVFKTNGRAQDMTGQHYLTKSSCTGCDQDALLYNMRDSDWTLLGWFGGCGSFECTGQKNVLVEDQTGHFFGQIGQAITNNTYFGPNVTQCVRKDAWNGYWCPGRDITVLMFMSTAPDYNKRLYSPIKLTNGLFFNEINSFFEWEWDGPEPLNKRESKFVALISTNTIINMSNAGINPTSSEYWLSKRNEVGSPDDFVIIKWQFQLSQIIQVSVNNKVIQPGLTTHSKHHDLNTMTNICGANNFFHENRTIHFVITGDLNCKVKISLKNTIQISTRLEITGDEFFGDKFLQYAKAQLGGDPYNYFIIGTKKQKRRFLGESVTSEIQVDWGIVHGAEIGTEESLTSNQFLSDIASKLESFVPPPEIGKVLEQTTQIAAITKLNYNSTEITKSTLQDPTDNNNNNQNNNNQNNNNQNSNGNNNNNSTSNNSTETEDDNVILVSDEEVNQSNSTDATNNTQNGAIQKAIKSNDSASQTVVIVVSVICSVVGVSLIIAGLLYYKKTRLAQIMASRAQRVDNEFFKVNITEQQLNAQPQHPE